MPTTLDAYNRLGGGRRALAHSADKLYDDLLPEDQVTAKRILLKLVQPGEGLEVTSKRVPQESLYLGGEAHDRIDRVLEKFIDARLIRLTQGETAADNQVEVAHEALVRNWPRLVDWLEGERERLRQRSRLTAAANEWEQHERDADNLLRGRPFEEALHYTDLNQLESEFVQTSQLALLKQTRRSYLVRIGDAHCTGQKINY